jgi:hypothetical protein
MKKQCSHISVLALNVLVKLFIKKEFRIFCLSIIIFYPNDGNEMNKSSIKTDKLRELSVEAVEMRERGYNVVGL